jgi:hypothetical protein
VPVDRRFILTCIPSSGSKHKPKKVASKKEVKRAMAYSSTLKMEAQYFSEMWENFYEEQHNPQDDHCCGNRKSNKNIFSGRIFKVR